jgi:hypothetical protein
MTCCSSPKRALRWRFAAICMFSAVASMCVLAQTYQASFQNARTLLSQKRYSEALQEAQRAIALDDSQWGAYYVAGTALVGLDRQSEAIGEFQAALPRAPETAKPVIDSAIAACRQILADKSQARPENNAAPTAQQAPKSQGSFAAKITDSLFIIATLGLSPEEWNDFDRTGGTVTMRAAHHLEKKMITLDSRGLSFLVGPDGQIPHATEDGSGHWNLVTQTESTIPCGSLAATARFPSVGTIEIASMRYFSTTEINDSVRALAAKFCSAEIR